MVIGRRMGLRHLAVIMALAALAACKPAAHGATASDSTSEPQHPADSAFAWPKDLAPIDDGYPAAGDPCRRLGESALTVDLLDDSATLVGCPGGAGDAATRALVAKGGRVVGAAQGVTLISMPARDANPGMAAALGKPAP